MDDPGNPDTVLRGDKTQWRLSLLRHSRIHLTVES
jgi:hypothetical protein